MGNNVDDIPWPARKPKRPKPAKGSSGGGNGTTVGLSIILFMALPLLVIGVLSAFMLHGYGII